MKKIKPILYHSFEEKEKIERELMEQIPYEKRKALAKELMDIFHNTPSEKSSIKSPKHSKKIQNKK
jgi:hypothetical protein